ncbi:MAG: DUF421 domain-containing protein [Clostridia bacterium]|nr:DUF421 domain-containing protein [Clostridia bacterium]
MPVLKILFTATTSYVVLFLSAKLIGHKQIAQLDSFDYITGITIGSIAAEMATDLENPWQSFTAMVVYMLLTWLMTMIGMHSLRSRKFLNGSPSIIMQNGRLFPKNMKKAKLDLSDFMVMCRQQGYFNLEDIHLAVFEYNGKLTILPTAANRPVTPEDLRLAPAQEEMSTEVIMDGRVLEENLRRMGLNAQWLSKQLKAQGIDSARKVFLGLCDSQNNLTVYPMEP